MTLTYDMPDEEWVRIVTALSASPLAQRAKGQSADDYATAWIIGNANQAVVSYERIQASRAAVLALPEPTPISVTATASIDSGVIIQGVK